MMEPTKSQRWARNLSKGLQSSYDSSALIEHKGTSGEHREHQIFDILKYLLPKKFAFEKNVVIVNSANEETIKFDGAIIDDKNWPMLFADDDIIVSPIESVKIAFEVKSNLISTELSKIYEEAKNLNNASPFDREFSAKVVGFAYKCPNIKLMYYDFANSFLTMDDFPTIICVLNVGILCFLGEDGIISKNPNKSCVPILLETGEDSLLVFAYLLTEYLSKGQVSSTIRRYSQHIYEAMPCFFFEVTFLDEMKSKPDEIRKFFEGNLDVNINDSYQEAKAKLHL